MAHPLVEQLRFTRSELSRVLRGVSEADGQRRLEPLNSIGWILGHLAWQEQRYWLTRCGGTTPLPGLNEVVASGGPASTPSLAAMRKAWRDVIAAAEPFLEGLGGEDLAAEMPPPGPRRTVGDAVHRVIYHYWFHIGEIHAIRQSMGHARLPEFVGELERRAPYRSG